MTTRHESTKQQRDNGMAVFRYAAVVALVGTVLMAAALVYWATLSPPEGGVHAPAETQSH